MHAITVVLWACMALCAVFTLAEQIAAARFSPWAYRIGLPSRHGAVDEPAPALATPPKAGETEHGRFVRLGDGRVLIHVKRRLFRVGPPFPLRGTVRFADGKAHLEARVGVAPFVLLLSGHGLLLATLFQRGMLSGAGRLVPHGLGFAVALLVWGSLRIERANLLSAYHEMLRVAPESP